MNTKFDYTRDKDTAWCPGCGNIPLLKILKQALEEMSLNPSEVVICSGIGQAAKMPQYIRSHYFNGLHGRAVPVATAVRMVNPGLTVIAEGGDGDMYGEGGNHFIHAIRRNPDIVHLVHNNSVYGLTKGQASPTSPIGFRTPVQVSGVIHEPFNPLAVALSLGATFIARTFVGNMELTGELIKAAIRHKGYALLDIFDPCVSFNKINTYAWYRENTYVIEKEYDASDKMKAFQKVSESHPFPLGILYQQKEGRLSLEEQLDIYQKDKTPLWKRKRSADSLGKLMEE